MALRAVGDEAVLEFIIHGPDERAVGLGNRDGLDLLAREVAEVALVDFGRQRVDGLAAVEKEHEPVAGALVAALTDHAEQVQVRRREVGAGLLLRLADRALEGRLAQLLLQLAPGRAPAAQVGHLAPADEQEAPLRILQEKQHADFERELAGRGGHPADKKGEA